MNSKALMFCLLSSVLILSPIAVSADQSWVGDGGQAAEEPNSGIGDHVQWFMDSHVGKEISYLLDDQLKSQQIVDPTCKSTADPRCNSPSLFYNSVIPTCQSKDDLFCIEEFGILTETNEEKPAKFNRNFPTKGPQDFPAEPNLNLPAGTTGSVFALPEATHQGGSLYYVEVFTSGNVNASGANLGRFSIRIFPVKTQPRSWGYAAPEDGWVKTPVNTSDGHQAGSWHQSLASIHPYVASSISEQMVLARYAFPAGIKFYVKVRMQSRPSGWMHGRIANPEISISGIPGNYTLRVAANPVAIPSVFKKYRYSEMPQTLKDQYDYTTGKYKPEIANWNQQQIQEALKSGCGHSACTPDPLTRNMMVMPRSSDSLGMDQLNLWIPFVDDKATELLGAWSMRTLDSNETAGAQRCFTDNSQGITGIVTTNATQYLAGPPQFNSTEQSLEYKVAAPHLTPKGEIFYGSYDLLMRSDVARCVYGFSKAPIKGSISITSDKGEEKVATELIKESNGWVSLSANGFTYSAPTIRVKLSQDKPEPVKVEETTPVAVAAPNQEVQQAAKPIVVSKKKTITCTKGKVTKKISGTNPKCPTGFKTKASPEPSSTTASTSTKRWIDEGDSCDPKITSTVKGYPKGMYITDWLKCDEQTRTYVVAKK